MNNIIIVCDEKENSDNLKSNLMLLRKFDTIICTKFLNAQETILQQKSIISILYSDFVNDEILSFINNFREIPILFISENYTDETLLSLYDAGITDYITTKQSQSEFLIKIMFCLRKSIETTKLERFSDILKIIGIINKKNDFFSKKYTPAVFKNFVEKSEKENIKVSIMAIAPDIEDKNKCNLEYLANLIKENLREEDVIGFGTDRIYILLQNTTYQGALEVYNKIKDIIKNSYSISSGIMEISSKTDKNIIFKKLDEALFDALEIKSCAVVQEDCTDEPPMNWLDKKNKKHKNFKLFKKVFLKKLETVIIPVFYQKQQIAEQRLFETKVEQFSDEKSSIFSLKNEKHYSYVEITYPGAVKININIFYDESSEPETQVFDLSQINEHVIGKIIDKLIRNFQKKY